MSAEDSVPTRGIPHFSAELIDNALTWAEAEPDEFRREQVKQMNAHNAPLSAFMTEKIIALGQRGESDACDRWVASYVAGHAILGTAVAAGEGLPRRDRDELHGFALYIHRNPLELATLVARDFAKHQAVSASLQRVESLAHGDIRGAHFILGAYGRWANRSRPPLLLPRVPEQTRPHGRRNNFDRVIAGFAQ